MSAIEQPYSASPSARPGAVALSAAQAVRYVGLADWWGRHVWLEREGTRASLPYCQNPAVSFAWGRAGLGSRELARAILRHATGSTQLAEQLCSALAREVLAELPEIGFELDRAQILAWTAAATEATSVAPHTD